MPELTRPGPDGTAPTAPVRRRVGAVLVVLALLAGGCSARSGATSARGSEAASAADAAASVAVQMAEAAAEPMDVPTTTGPPAGPVRFGSGPVAAWAKGQVELFAAPGGTRRVGTYPARNPWGGVSVFLVDEALRDEQGRVWLKVYVPRRPNGGTAWARGADFMVAPLRHRITVDLSERRLVLYRDDKAIRTVRVAIGSPRTPTPVGQFFITVKLQPPVISRVYGAWALGLSGYSDVLDQFGTGDGQIALHGTWNPASIGQAVSNGCIRMSNEDVTALAKVAPLGTPVTIVA